MSMNKTLKSKQSLSRHRNVLSRAERIGQMKDDGLWTDESLPVGLPKISHRKAKVGKKEKKKDEAAAGTDAAAGAKPTAAAKPAK